MRRRPPTRLEKNLTRSTGWAGWIRLRVYALLAGFLVWPEEGDDRQPICQGTFRFAVSENWELGGEGAGGEGSMLLQCSRGAGLV